MPPSTAPSYLRALWYKWRSLKLPWRSRWLCGFDLQGNTYWESTNKLSPGRARRIARYPSGTHYGDVNLSPAWLQWLRHTRPEPPSLDEQQADMQRQQDMIQLAAAADARWHAKGSYLDTPELRQLGPQLEPGSGQSASTGKMGNEHTRADDPRSMVGESKPEQKADKTTDPWATHARPSSGAWQPESWKPFDAARRS